MSLNFLAFPATDYLEPQPALATGADVFLLRAVIHDLSDKYATKLLTNLRQAATANTKLIVIDNIVEYACPVPQDPDFLVPGYEPATAPAPLLPNFGAARVFQYNLDINVSFAHTQVEQIPMLKGYDGCRC